MIASDRTGRQLLAATDEWRCRAEIAEQALRRVHGHLIHLRRLHATPTVAYIVAAALDELADLE